MSILFILIIAIILAVLFFLLKRWLYKKQREYSSNSYWENRYDWYKQTMDWYANYSKANEDFKIEEIIQEQFNEKKSKLKILELGCGNSDFASDMYDRGYTNYTAIDYSKNVIKQMNEKFQNKKINFMCADYLQLDKTFEKKQFDIIIEKAGLDSIVTKETKDVPELLFSAYQQIHFALKDNGILLSISNKNPEYWKENAFKKIVKHKLFKVHQIKRMVFTVPNNSTLMNYYFYYLKKLPKD